MMNSKGAAQTRQRAYEALKRGDIVHLYSTKEPHLVDGEDACWCEPEVTEYVSGGVLLVHKSPTWH